MSWTLTTSGEAETARAGHVLANLLEAGDVILLSGDLGAGKTALVKGLAGGLGVHEPVTSPTFNILLVHPGRLPLFHVDLYRLDSAAQLEDIDYFDTLEAGGVTAVEWGDRFPAARPDDYLSVHFTIVDDTERTLRVGSDGPRGAALEAVWFDACRELPGLGVGA